MRGLTVGCALLVVACAGSTVPDGDGNGEAETALLMVVIGTAGASFDADGYVVAVDTVNVQTTSADDTLTFALVPGDHHVAISGFAFNCGTLSGDTAWVLQVRIDETRRHPIDVHCIDTTGRILYSSAPGISATNDVYTVGASRVASPVPRIVSDTNDITVAISADVRLAVSRDPPSSGSPAFIFVVVSTPEVHQVTFHQSQAIFPTWSPDGLQLAFCTSRDGHGEIYTVSVAPDSLGVSTPVRLTNSLESCRPDWSPDGTKIAYESRVGSFLTINTVAPDGTGVTQVSDCQTISPPTCYAPKWSPDGTRILVSGGSAPVRQYVMDADGSNVTLLADSAEYSAWSPDGTRIVYSKRVVNPYQLFIMDVGTRRKYQLTTDDAQWDRYPVWVP